MELKFEWDHLDDTAKERARIAPWNVPSSAAKVLTFSSSANRHIKTRQDIPVIGLDKDLRRRHGAETRAKRTVGLEMETRAWTGVLDEYVQPALDIGVDVDVRTNTITRDSVRTYTGEHTMRHGRIFQKRINGETFDIIYPDHTIQCDVSRRDIRQLAPNTTLTMRNAGTLALESDTLMDTLEKQYPLGKELGTLYKGRASPPPPQSQHQKRDRRRRQKTHVGALRTIEKWQQKSLEDMRRAHPAATECFIDPEGWKNVVSRHVSSTEHDHTNDVGSWS
jgi:hypothetical protein